MVERPLIVRDLSTSYIFDIHCCNFILKELTWFDTHDNE